MKETGKSFPTAEEAIKSIKSKLLTNDRVDVIDLQKKLVSMYTRKEASEFSAFHVFNNGKDRLEETVTL